MARGFESKDVEFQQAEAQRVKRAGPEWTAGQSEAQSRRRTLELALTRARTEREAARSPAHRQMLDAALADLEVALQRIKSNAAS